MRRYMSLVCASLCLTACASVDVNSEAFATSIRPIEHQAEDDLSHQLILAKAQNDYDNGRYDESYDSFQLAALKHPQSLPARIGWGNAAIALNLFEKAYEVFSHHTDLVEASETEKHAHLAGLVLAEVATGRAVDEEVRLNEALEYNLHDVRLWNALGRFHDKQENWVPAQRTYLKALNTGAATRASVVNNLGMSFLKQGQYNVALEKFEQALQLNPDRGLYDNNRRLTLVLMNQYGTATQNISQERAADMFNDAGYIALHQKKYEIAEALITRAIEVSPHFNVEAETNLTRLKAELNDIHIQDDITLSTDNDASDWGYYVSNP